MTHSAGRVILANAAVLEAPALATQLRLEHLEVKGRCARCAGDLPDAQRVCALVVRHDPVGHVCVMVVVGTQQVRLVDAPVVHGRKTDALAQAVTGIAFPREHVLAVTCAARVLTAMLSHDFAHRALQRLVVVLCRERYQAARLAEERLTDRPVHGEALRHGHA